MRGVTKAMLHIENAILFSKDSDLIAYNGHIVTSHACTPTHTHARMHIHMYNVCAVTR